MIVETGRSILPLPYGVRYFSQMSGPNGPAKDDPGGCWYACGKMIRVWYGGPVTPLKDVEELVNPDGTHDWMPMGGTALSTFAAYERLIPFSPNWTVSQDVDADLTNTGPIMVTWWTDFGLHCCVIVGVQGNFILYHDPAIGPGQPVSLGELNRRRADGNTKIPLYCRNPKTIAPGHWVESSKKELSLASDTVTKKGSWPTGWWRVWDGGTWYYYLADGKIAMSSKTPPSGDAPPGKGKIHNLGKWNMTSEGLVIEWNKVNGATAPCKETFWNATIDCRRMNANSTLYSPLVATRYPE